MQELAETGCDGTERTQPSEEEQEGEEEEELEVMMEEGEDEEEVRSTSLLPVAFLLIAKLLTKKDMAVILVTFVSPGH